MAVTVETIEDTRRFQALAAEWDELLTSSRACSLFLTHEWLSTWWTHLGTRRRLAVVTARARSGRLLAALPLALAPPQPSRLMPAPRFELLGSGHVGSDYLDLIARDGYEDEAIAAVGAKLTAEGRVLALWHVGREGATVSRLAAALQQQGWGVVEARTDVCPFIDLSGLTWDGYLASLGSSHRYNFNRRWRRLTEAGATFDVARTPEEADAALDALMRLHEARWEARGGGSEAFPDAATVRFHRAFVGLALGRGWLRLFTLRVGDAAVASIYALCHRGRYYFYQSGFDPAHARHSVGLVIMGLAIKHAIEEGATEYDLLHGSEPYKFQWARRAREVSRLELYPPHALGTLWRSASTVNRHARRAARHVLDRVGALG